MTEAEYIRIWAEWRKHELSCHTCGSQDHYEGLYLCGHGSALMAAVRSARTLVGERTAFEMEEKYWHMGPLGLDTKVC